MLDARELAALYRGYRDQNVLSVYLDASQTDPALRSAWHTRFRDGLRAVRRDLEAEGGDIDAFDAAADRLTEALGDPEAFLQGRGWVGFATSDETLGTEGVPVPMPNLIRWEPGIRVAPYLRALKHARPIVAVVADSRRARLHRYVDGSFDEVADLHAESDFGDLSESTTSKRAQTGSGVRGTTGKDKSRSLKDVETQRLVERAAQAIAAEAGEEGVIVLGGTGPVVAQIRKAMEGSLATRSTVRPKLSFDLASADLRAEVEAAASEMSKQQQAELLERVFDLALSGGDACLGLDETERAIREGRVRTLVVSDGLRRSNPDHADHLIGSAFEAGAAAVEVAGDPVRRLDEEGEGVAALLHYRIQAADTSS